MKSVASKLRRGDYCILMTMHDRLGGHRIGWTKIPKHVGISGDKVDELTGCSVDPMQHRAAATKPVPYSGKYYDRELRFDQSVYALCPSPRDVRPCNVLVFELFEMASRETAIDTVVGWSCLPMSDAHFRIAHGRFRLPFMRGPVDKSVKKFGTMERRYCNDLSLWLANLYIDIRHMPRDFHDKEGGVRGEFDVEVDRIASRMIVNSVEEEGGEEGGVEGGGEGDAVKSPIHDPVVNKGIKTNNEWTEKASTILKKRNEEKVEVVDEQGEKKMVVVKKEKKRRRKKKEGEEEGGGATKGVGVVEKGGIDEPDSDSDHSDGEDGGRVLSKNDRSVLPGDEVDGAADNTNKKQVLSNWTDTGVGIKRGKTGNQREREFKWHTLTDTVEMENYAYAVASDPNLSHKPSPDRILSRKLTYLVEELFEDMNVNSFMTVEFFVNLIIIVCALWLRM